jgi:hypothetical protein
VLPYSALVNRGVGDAASIDSTVLGLEARSNPMVSALRVVERFGPAMSPPVVLVNGDTHLAHRLEQSLLVLPDLGAGRAALELGLVERFVAAADADYDGVRAIADQVQPHRETTR